MSIYNSKARPESVRDGSTDIQVKVVASTSRHDHQDVDIQQ